MRGLKVAVHAHGNIGIKNAIRAGADTIEHASYLDDEAISMAKRKGVYFSMDIYNTEYTLAEGEKNGVLQESLDKERQVGGIQRESFRKAVKAGAKVIFGTDAAIYPHGDNAKQFSRMVKFGMTPLQAIQASTSLAAEALGKTGNFGCLSAGCSADIIAVSGDPLADVSVLENVDFVMKDGLIYKGEQ
jgi:imidazolonepropionase-like amidohydrolase